MWTNPSPSWADEIKCFEDGLFSTSMSDDYGTTCFFRDTFSDPVCARVVKNYPKIDFVKLETFPFVCKPDKYWKKYATIPTHASVMVINGGLDFQTPREWGRAEYEGLTGGDKMRANFDTGGHCAGISRQTASDATFCGYAIMTSFVLGGGDVSKVNTSCVSSLPPMDFDRVEIYRGRAQVRAADELYDSE